MDEPAKRAESSGLPAMFESKVDILPSVSVVKPGEKRSATFDPVREKGQKRLQRMSEYMMAADSESDTDEDEIESDQVSIGFVTKDPKPRRMVTAQIHQSGQGLNIKVLNMSVKFKPMRTTKEHSKVAEEHKSWWALDLANIKRRGLVTIVVPNYSNFEDLRKFVFDNTEVEHRQHWGWSSYSDMAAHPWIRDSTAGLSRILELSERQQSEYEYGSRDVMGRNMSSEMEEQTGRLMLEAVRASSKKMSELRMRRSRTISDLHMGGSRKRRSESSELFDSPDSSDSSGSIISTIVDVQVKLVLELMKIRARATDHTENQHMRRCQLEVIDLGEEYNH